MELDCSKVGNNFVKYEQKVLSDETPQKVFKLTFCIINEIKVQMVGVAVLEKSFFFVKKIQIQVITSEHFSVSLGCELPQ